MVAPWSAPDAHPVEPAIADQHTASGDAEGAMSPAPIPAGATLVTHPLTRFDIVDTALDTIKAAPRVVLGATALFLVPFEVVSLAIRHDQLDVQDLNEVITPAWFVAIALRLIALSFVTFAVARLVWAWQRGEAPGALTVAGEALRRAPALLVAWVLVHVAELAATVALFLPLLFVAPLLFAAVPAIAIEGCGPIAGMARSWRLGARDAPLAIGGMVVVVVVTAILSVSLSGLVYVSDTVFDTLGIGGAWVVAVAISFATSMILLPFVAAASTLVYLDLRVRREGLDIELAADRHFDVA